MPLSVGMHAALVVGPTSFFNQLHPRPTLVSNGRDAAQRVDGTALLLGPTIYF
jgi:hypothetical protein